jgi:protein involved in polysaccharide export with SLBB domain
MIMIISNKLLHIYVLCLLSLLLCFTQAQPVMSQDEATGPVGDSAAAPTGEETGPVLSEDSSLFVGHYRMNPGDIVKVEIISDVGRAFSEMIDEEGYIALPVIGRVMIANLTTIEARAALQELVDQYYKKAWVTVQVQNLGKVKFYVYGDIQRPGFYTATSATTVIDFLQTIGMISGAGHRRIVHVRGNPVGELPEESDLLAPAGEPTSELIEKSLNLEQTGQSDLIDPRVTILDPLIFTLEGDIEQRNFYLEFGDIIYIPDPIKSIAVEGFSRSGPLEVLPGETWPDIIAMSGPPLANRNISNMLIERRDEDGQVIQIYYNLSQLNNDQLEQIPLVNRDSLKILPSEVNVYILGAVNKAGALPYMASTTPLDYLALAEGPTKDAHLRFAVILRPPREPSAPLEASEIIPCDLLAPFLSEGPIGASMQAGDILYIPDKGQQATMDTVFTALSVLVNTVRLFQ